MAAFDPERNCCIVRVVYDGPGFAGKTTNLRRICELIPAASRSEMYTPAELKGRTMFFDWLELDGPTKNDVMLKFHLITVPGQEQRNYRRRPLVEQADVVVFVGDSAEDNLAGTQRTFARLRASMKQRDKSLPLVVQANKQDVDGAVAPERLRHKLRLGDDVPVLGASAAAGDGVRETLSAAIKLGLATVDDAELAPLLAEFANADALFDHVLTFEDNPSPDEPIDVEELYLKAEEIDVSGQTAAAHLAAASLDELQSRARRAAARNAEANPENPSAPRQN
jgi:signal recognition particle receptor subunit beta